METFTTRQPAGDQTSTVDQDDPGDWFGSRLPAHRRPRHPAALPAADLAHLPDGDLVSLAQAGSCAAFEQLMARHQRAIQRYLLRRTHDPELTADLLQETFLDAWQYLARVRDGDGFGRWLFRVARNNLLPTWRRRPCTSIEQVIDEAGDVPAALQRADDTDACHERVLIAQAFARLGESGQAALSASLQGLSSDEVAQALGIAAAAARKRITRAKHQFRAAYRAAQGGVG